MIRRPPRSPLFPSPPLSRSGNGPAKSTARNTTKMTPKIVAAYDYTNERGDLLYQICRLEPKDFRARQDRKSTRLNSSHSQISYAVFCLKKKKQQKQNTILKQ